MSKLYVIKVWTDGAAKFVGLDKSGPETKMALVADKAAGWGLYYPAYLGVVADLQRAWGDDAFEWDAVEA